MTILTSKGILLLSLSHLRLLLLLIIIIVININKRHWALSLVEVRVDSLAWSSGTSKILIIPNSKLLWIETSRAAHVLELIVIEHLVEIERSEEIIHK